MNHHLSDGFQDGMDRKRRQHDDHAETGSSYPAKRPRILPNDHNTIHEPANASPSHDDYTIAWICALHIEMAAARAILDEIHEDLPRYANDSNTYMLGSIRKHNIVIACLPTAQYGTNNAANVLTHLIRTFPSIHLGLMVGIGGGVPIMADIRLGDIVVGTRVMQCDLGKIVEDGQIRRTAIPRILQNQFGTLMSTLRSTHEREPSRVPCILREKFGGLPGYGRPSLPDHLFYALYEHASSTPGCNECDDSKLVPRRRRESDDPQIHYGAIASGNQVMRSGTARDKVARELDVICFEMEAAGLMDILPCLPIRGICDYSDSHKSKEWQRYAAATAAAYARELLEVLPVAEAHARVAHVTNPHQYSSHERRQRLLASLRFEQIDSRKQDIKTAQAKTCRWFLGHPDYQAWLDPGKSTQHDGFLWISGKPGAGKSTIMKFAYSSMKSKARHEHAITASFFFNARGEYLEKSILGMYRSLLLQLLEGYPDLQAVLDDPDLTPYSQDDCPSLSVLKDLFRNAVSALGHRSFTCFIDALDECDEQQVVDMVQYFEELVEQSTKGTLLRVCFSSRHYPYIVLRQGIRLTLEDQPGHAKDLENYIGSRLQISDPALIEELQPQILEKAAGVFLWVVLVIDILNKEDRRGRPALRKRLAEIPSGLSELFKDILRRDNDNMEDLLLCILWILYSKRPLRPKEFYHALWSGLSLKDLADSDIPTVTGPDSSDRIKRYVISSSKGLAEITKSKQQPTVQFIHESVRDFLIKDKGLHELWPDLGFDWEIPSHERLKQCCSAYIDYYHLARISMVNSDEQGEISKKFPFLEYASRHVLYHADAAASAIPQDEFLTKFSTSGWITIINRFERYKARQYTPDASLLYILADKGFAELIRTQPKEQLCTYIPKERYRYALFAALANGHKHAVAALLNLPSSFYNGADIADGLTCRKDFKEYKDRTPLSWAAQNGRTGIIELLLQNRMTVMETDRGGRQPLSRASEKGHDATARLLIERGADVNASDKDGRTPLSWASWNGHEATVGLLIEKGADVNASGKGGRTPLSWALENGHEATARLLIEKGADVNASGAAQTPLSSASWNGHEATARLLIEKGADVNASGAARTPLSSASWNGHEATARLLIEKGADVNASDKHGGTPLSSASENGHEAMAGLLIEKGADVNASDKHGRTPLSSASLRGHEATARLLIEKGADVNASGAARTPLSSASWNGHEATARLLIEKGADVNASDKDGGTPLSWASLRGVTKPRPGFSSRGEQTSMRAIKMAEHRSLGPH
ncbi:Pfs, NACHT and ankyrin domain protein [Dactylonectria macrodidyma]|uniref:protein S-acyltransferase n=1 Tax=Dactylonectria macrodidyma TaxID=307937 RepID=A0A9P9IUA6_9HYPO|nr:Pfs, NACHT and ankyrin domain protein [Dactylonectria macrodidyma]